MTDSLSIFIAQLDPTVGDIAGNLGRLRDAWREAKTSHADLLVASELFVAGYPPEDLVLKPAFVAACEAAVKDFARETKDGPAVLLGTPWTGSLPGKAPEDTSPPQHTSAPLSGPAATA